MLQIATILILMVAAPVVAIAIEAAMTGGSLIALAGKWFVFFFGLRLLIAGFHQLANPDSTAKTIFRIDDPNAGEDRERTRLRQHRHRRARRADDFQCELDRAGRNRTATLYALAGAKHVMNAQRTSSKTGRCGRTCGRRSCWRGGWWLDSAWRELM